MKITRQHKKPLEFRREEQIIGIWKTYQLSEHFNGSHPSFWRIINNSFRNLLHKFNIPLSFIIYHNVRISNIFLFIDFYIDTDEISSCFYIGYFSFESSTSQSLIILQLTTIISREQYLCCILCNGNESWSGQFRLIACICKCHQKCIYKLQHKQQKTRVFIFKGLCKRSKSVSYSVRRVMTFSM